jgi:mersacidin/lichenicidin family type 2 lantibiotic
MSNSDIIRAWKDDDYSGSLSEAQRSQLPANPAGIIELSDEDMEIFAGGDNQFTVVAGGNCQVSNAALGCIFG